VSEVAGTTRDTIDTLVSHDGKQLLVIDTAGIRRSGAVQPGIEKYSVLRSVRAIDRAEVAVLLMDATEPATAQDTHIASPILEAYRSVVLAVNKWDLSEDRKITKEAVERQVRSRFKFLPYAPVCFVSALKGTGVKELLDTVCEVHSEWTKTLPRYTLRRTILEAVAENPPATSGRRVLKIFGVDQDQAGPPTFTFYVNRPEMVHFTYQRYLENAIRKAYGFKGSPLRFRFKGIGEQ
jgi:GTP-binding protein